ncbi:Bidirectional sugar transporter SWEET3a [Dendrobium catenatum]|uniref:Bidirectional sugar transporter SWEET3a n=1 Tax=Dendrobium catenatum TaxID=906689 RepID=A0A2I0WAF7_9ASPA|nr:Bidirectional sugar transporter SWEET3a [Dendrobium catenatum]
MKFSFFFLFRLTFKRVIQKRSTGEYSCIPYSACSIYCLNYTWYGLPIVSYGWGKHICGHS